MRGGLVREGLDNEDLEGEGKEKGRRGWVGR